jgi:DNA-binding NtrC family response regulator
VDDDEAICTALAMGLRQEGFDVYVAADGRRALEIYRGHEAGIALVLLDVRLPCLDGPQTLAILRRLNPDVRCCFMTAQVGLWRAEDLLALGAIGMLAKPFDLDDITSTVRRLVNPAAPAPSTR